MPQQVDDRIELPPIKPDVTRVRLFRRQVRCCGARVTAASPSGLEPGSPFGQSIAALVVYLHYAHAIGLERLAALMGELFAVSIRKAPSATCWPVRASRCWQRLRRSARR